MGFNKEDAILTSVILPSPGTFSLFTPFYLIGGGTVYCNTNAGFPTPCLPYNINRGGGFYRGELARGGSVSPAYSVLTVLKEFITNWVLRLKINLRTRKITTHLPTDSHSTNV